MERVRVLGARLTVWLPSLVAVLSFATGVAALATGESGTLSGPLAAYLPTAVRQTAAFTGTLTGFLMLVSTYGLRRGYRAAWYATVVLLPVTAVQGLLQATVFSLPLVLLSLLSMPTIVVRRKVFVREIDLSTTQLAALGALVGSLIYGTVGSWVLRDEFGGGIDSLVDAVYFAIVTSSTVGYGDISPQTDIGRLFGASYLIIGTAAFAVALGTLLGPAIEARFQRALGAMTDDDISLISDHVIVVGFSDLTEPIVEQLTETHGGPPFVVITQSPERATPLRERGMRVFVADPSEDEPLQRAGIGRARAIVVATDDDAQDALAILTARELNPDIRIVAGASDRENMKKLRRAGADEVISPAVIGGNLLVRSALGEGDAEATAQRVIEEGSGPEESH